MTMSPKMLTRNLLRRRAYNKDLAGLSPWRKSEYRRIWGLICVKYPSQYRETIH